MAAKKAKSERKLEGAAEPAGTKRRRGVSIRPTELTATDLADVSALENVQALAAQVEAEGGAVLAKYREPLGGHEGPAWLCVSRARLRVSRHAA